MGVKSNDFVLCQMYREGVLTLDAVRQLRRNDRKLTYTRQQADKSIICRKEVITKDQFIDLIRDATVQMSLSRLSTPSLRNILSNEDSGSSRIKMLFLTPSDSS